MAFSAAALIAGMLVGAPAAHAAATTPGAEIVFQAGGSGHLWTVDANNTGHDTQLKMAPGSSPAITTLAGGGTEIAFVATDYSLWEVAPDGTARRAANGLGVMPGTTPAIAALPSGGFQIAFQAYGEGTLWTVDANNTGHDTQLKMAPGSSPAITTLAGGGTEIAFVATDYSLWEVAPDGTPRRAANGLGVMPGTTPAIAALPSGGFQIAFQAYGERTLWTVDANNTGHDIGLGIETGSSPAITGLT